MKSRWWLAALTLVTVWCAAMMLFRRRVDFTDDWHGWRQADTAAMARNYEDLLHPRIDWGGTGPGYVEAEMPLYPALMALGVPGPLLSLGCTALTALLLFAALRRRFGDAAALCALVAALSTRGMVTMSTSIQPDSLSLLAYAIGFVAFLRWLDEPRLPTLAAWVIATTVAGLVKPTTLELGLTQGLLCLAHPRVLRRPSLWLGWAFVVVSVGAWLLHARGLYLTYGNTFGVLSGGDRKVPSLARLLELHRWWSLLRLEVVWGIGLLAVPAIFLRRRLSPEIAALAAGAVALDVLAFRYTSHRFGTHYHLPHVVLGAWLVASAVRWRAAVPVAVVAAGVLVASHVRELRAQPPEPETVLGRELAALAPRATLVAVRARAERVSAEWGVANNFEDPRIFYLSRTRGWALPAAEPGAALLASYAALGARFYVHVAQYPIDPELAAWLQTHAELVVDRPEGVIYRVAL